MTLSIIVPAIQSAAKIEGTLRTAAAQLEPATEVFLVLPPDSPAPEPLFGASVIRAGGASLPVLLNAGARATTGNVLLFACPPVLLPPTAAQTIARNLSLLPTTIGGSFHQHFEGAGAPGHLFAKMVKRMRYHRHYDWDSSIFIRTEVFSTLGGVASTDRCGHQFARRMESTGATVYPPDEISLPAGYIFKLMWRWLAVYPFTTERNSE